MKRSGIFNAMLLLLLGAAPSWAAAPLLPGNTDLPLLQRSRTANEDLQLGELALQNNDDLGAVEFLQNAMQGGLTDEDSLARVLNGLHGSYLRTQQVDLADELLRDPDMQGLLQKRLPLKKLLEMRRAAYDNNSAKVVELGRDLTVEETPGNEISCEILELLGRAQHQLGDHANARNSFERLLKIAAADTGAYFTALDGIVLNSLALKDIKRAQSAMSQLESGSKTDGQKKFAARLQQLRFLVDAYSGKIDGMEKTFRQTAAAAGKPAPLPARIALLLADHYAENKEYKTASGYYRMAFDLAEPQFRQTALRAMLENDLAVGDLSNALKNTQLYRKDYPQAADIQAVALLEAHLHNHLKNTRAAEVIYAALQKDEKIRLSIRYASALELIKIYQKSNRVREAETQFRFAIGNAPDLEQKNMLRQLLGEYYYQLGRYPEAADCFKEAAGDGSKRAAFWLAQTYYRQESFDRADRALQMFSVYGDAELQRQADYLQALVTEKLRGADPAIAGYMEFVRRYPQAPEAPDALFQAGLLARTSSKYKSHEIFRQYADSYPGAHAANALYKALSELLNHGNITEAEKLFRKMTEDYASSKYTVSAYFAMVDFLRRSKKYPEAQTLLDTLDKLYSSKHPEIVPEILYDRAVLCGEVKDHKNMLKALEKLTLQHASSALAPQAFFLLGDLQMLRGEYKAALSAFQQAHERSGGGAFAFCCLGRTADAAFALYSVSREAQYLRQATEGYENLLKVNDLPSELYVQTLYKYGRCLNEVGNKAGALHCYRKLLYSALLDKQQNRYYSLHWSAKALDAALKLLGAEIRQEKDERKILALYDEGVYLLNVARVLGLDNEDIETRLQALQKLRRKAE